MTRCLVRQYGGVLCKKAPPLEHFLLSSPLSLLLSLLPTGIHAAGHIPLQSTTYCHEEARSELLRIPTFRLSVRAAPFRRVLGVIDPSTQMREGPMLLESTCNFEEKCAFVCTPSLCFSFFLLALLDERLQMEPFGAIACMFYTASHPIFVEASARRQHHWFLVQLGRLSQRQHPWTLLDEPRREMGLLGMARAVPFFRQLCIRLPLVTGRETRETGIHIGERLKESAIKTDPFKST